MTRFLKLAFVAPCALLAASPTARAQNAAYQHFPSSQFVQPGQIGQIDPHQTGSGALACPRIGVLASLYNEEGLATGGNSNASVASAQIAAAQAGCVTLPPGSMVQVLSFYQLSAPAKDKGSGYLQIQGSVTHGAQWVGAGAVFPLPANQSGPTPSAFGIDPSAKPQPQPAPVPAAQSLPQPNNPPANPPVPQVPQNGAPTMALPPVPPSVSSTPPAVQNQNANQSGSYEPLPTLPPATPTKPTPNGACGDIDSLLNATQSGHGCTQP